MFFDTKIHHPRGISAFHLMLNVMCTFLSLFAYVKHVPNDHRDGTPSCWLCVASFPTISCSNHTKSTPPQLPNIISKQTPPLPRRPYLSTPSLTHRPQEVVLLDHLPPLIPHGLRQPTPGLARLFGGFEAAVSAGQVHTLFVERHFGSERFGVQQGALSQGFGGALALFFRFGCAERRIGC
jgi:hypothetical protein